MNVIGINKTPKVSALKHCIAGAAFCLAAGLTPLAAQASKPDFFGTDNKTEQKTNNTHKIITHLFGMLSGGLTGFLLTRIGVTRDIKHLQNPKIYVPAGCAFGAAAPFASSLCILFGATGLAVSNKFIPPFLVQERANKIFLHNYSEEDAQNLQKKYSSLLRTENKDEFIDNLFNELRTDFKLGNLPITLNKDYKSEQVDAIKSAAAVDIDYEKGYTIGINKEYSNQDLLRHMTHEMRHIKQDIIECCSSTPEELYNSIFCLLKDINETKHAKRSQEDIAYEALFLAKQKINFFKQYGILPDSLDKKSKLYEFGRNIYESKKYYANKSENNYNNSYYEEDAKKTEWLMRRFALNSMF